MQTIMAFTWRDGYQRSTAAAIVIWDADWGAFTLPMTKVRHGPDAAETATRAALRVGAEALGVPVRVIPGTLRLPFARETFSGRLMGVRRYAYRSSLSSRILTLPSRQRRVVRTCG